MLVAHALGQSGGYTMYYSSGPLETMHAASGTTGIEVALERTTHYFNFYYRTVANGPVSSTSAYPSGLITSSGVEPAR